MLRAVCAGPLRQRIPLVPLCRFTPTFVQKRYINTEKEKKEDIEAVAKQASSEQGYKGSLITWKSVSVMVMFGAIGLYVLDKMKKQRYKEIHKIASVGDPDIGSPFFLVDQYGKPTSDVDFRGKYMFIYFGFTYCPDVCPVELKKMADVLNTLEKKGLADQIAPLMISIDPWRDTVEQLRLYIKDYHPRILALTGTPGQVTKVAKKFRVFMNKVDETTDGEYLIDHSVILYLMGPDGKFIKFFGGTVTPQEMAEHIANLINPPPQSTWQTFKRAFGLE